MALLSAEGKLLAPRAHFFRLRRSEEASILGQCLAGNDVPAIRFARTDGNDMKLRLKRAYDKPEPADGLRVLVDRLWPRGLKKDNAGVDLWLKDIAPSDALRRWFGHDPAKWAEFRRRYRAEIGDRPDAIETLRREVSSGTVTLLFGARDEAHNQAVVLKEFIEERS